MLLNEGSKCDSCEKFQRSTDKPITMKEKIANSPGKLNAPLSRANLNRVCLFSLLEILQQILNIARLILPRKL